MDQQAVAERSPSFRSDGSGRVRTGGRIGQMTAETGRPRVAVVERFPLVAEAVGLTLKQSCEAVPVPLQSCGSAADAYDAVRRTRAEVAVLIASPDEAIDLLTLVEQLSADGVSVLVTGEALDFRSAERFLYAGATSVWHGNGIAGVVRAVEHEAERRSSVAHASPRALAASRRPPTQLAVELDPERRARRDLGRLSSTETKILWALMAGKSAEEIARDHVVSVATVRTQIRQTLTKLGVRSQLSAVALAWHVGWSPASR